MTGKIQFVRRTLQAVSFFFLLYLILQAAFPLEVKIPVDLYLRLDPFIAIVTLLTQGEIIVRMLPAFGGSPPGGDLRQFLLRMVLPHGGDHRLLRPNPLPGEEKGPTF